LCRCCRARLRKAVALHAAASSHGARGIVLKDLVRQLINKPTTSLECCSLHRTRWISTLASMRRQSWCFGLAATSSYTFHTSHLPRSTRSRLAVACGRRLSDESDRRQPPARLCRDLRSLFDQPGICAAVTMPVEFHIPLAKMPVECRCPGQSWGGGGRERERERESHAACRTQRAARHTPRSASSAPQRTAHAARRIHTPRAARRTQHNEHRAPFTRRVPRAARSTTTAHRTPSAVAQADRHRGSDTAGRRPLPAETLSGAKGADPPHSSRNLMGGRSANASRIVTAGRSTRVKEVLV
jgi:hypothetical protein